MTDREIGDSLPSAWRNELTMTETFIPERAVELTPEWLTEVLLERGHLTGEQDSTSHGHLWFHFPRKIESGR